MSVQVPRAELNIAPSLKGDSNDREHTIMSFNLFSFLPLFPTLFLSSQCAIHWPPLACLPYRSHRCTDKGHSTVQSRLPSPLLPAHFSSAFCCHHFPLVLTVSLTESNWTFFSLLLLLSFLARATLQKFDLLAKEGRRLKARYKASV